MDNLSSTVYSSFSWRFLQSISRSLISFVIQIVLARYLLPEDFGLIAIANVFITIANVFIDTGLSQGIVQKKDITDNQINCIAVLNVVISIVLYLIIFIIAPLVARVFDNTLLVNILRILGIVIIVSGISSPIQAVLYKNFKYKKIFLFSLISVIVQGFVGIVLVIMNAGIWALVYSNLLQAVVYALLLVCFCRLKGKLQFSFNSIWSIINFSYKLLLQSLLNTIYNNLQSLLMGKYYSKASLGYMSKGQQFPYLIMNNVDGALSNVLFSSFSYTQDDIKLTIKLLRQSMRMSLYVCVPLMVGLACVSDTLIPLLLTDKWMGAIPFVKIFCCICILWPMSARVHVLNALGKSGITLKLNIVGKCIGVVCMLIALPMGVFELAFASFIGSIISLFIGVYAVSRNLSYSIKDQLKDLLPSIGMSVIMGLVVNSLELLNLHGILLLVLQVIVGIIVYIIESLVFMDDSFSYICSMIFKRKEEF